MIKVLLTDDHPMVIKGLRFFLSTQSDMEIVGEAQTGIEAVELAQTLKPDVILMDVKMPGMDGVEATKAIKATSPETKIIVLTSFSDQETVLPVLKAGANGYQLKDIEPDALVETIRAVFHGEKRLHPQATNQLLTHLTTPVTPEIDGFDALTPREKDVLREITDGKGNKEIADALSITEKTVKTHVSNLLSKLGLHDRTQAAILATKNHWFDQ
ncbi:response regulator [Camelliibacillus cellulosilyticus]|uniref:Response regulator n=1 Tax=Camelliibacillus cellulosilyticus TaxID=2174486 RepID=A0ABV9GRQ2_9BACL